MTRKTQNEIARFQIDGEMTIFRATELREKIMQLISGNDGVEIDLSHVTEVDGAGMQLMVSAKLEAILRGKTLRFSGHSKPILDMLDMSDLGGFFGDQVVMSSKATQH